MSEPVVAVVGAGIMGRAAAWQLAQDGARVTVFEQAAEGSLGGSSGGVTRGLRYSYEDPAYARLAMHADTWWRYAERKSGKSLLRMTGGLDIGMPGSPSFHRTVATVRSLGLDHTLYNAGELGRAFPHFRVPDAASALYQPGAGIIHAAQAMEALLALAREEGAAFRFNARVNSWRSSGGQVIFDVSGHDGGVFSADAVVLAEGPWLAATEDPTLGALARRAGLRVLRCGPLTVQAPRNRDWESSPLYYLHPDGDYPSGIYGQSQPSSRGDLSRMKIGVHDGEPVAAPGSDPAASPEDHDPLVTRAADFVPSLRDATPVFREQCYYTMTRDEGFLIDWLDDGRKILVVGGFSGHGFKFAPVIGRVVADLLGQGATEFEVQGMRAGRFGRLPN